MTHGKWSGYVVRNHTKQNQIRYRGRSARLPGTGTSETSGTGQKATDQMLHKDEGAR